MEKEQIISQTAVTYGQSKDVGTYALAAVVNGLRAAEVEQCHVDVQIVIPEYAFRSRLHTMEKKIRKVCVNEQISLREVKVWRTPMVNIPMVTAFATGRTKTVTAASEGRDILLTKWVGMEGMLRILEEKEVELTKRFSSSFLKHCAQFQGMLFDCREVSVARSEGVSHIRQVTEGGIFAALWELSKELGTGIDVDLKRIPIRQETIEICECFRLNPYQLTSVSSFLVVASDGEMLVEQMREQGIAVMVIGRITDNNDKVIRSEGEFRYLDRPAPDEMERVILAKESWKERW